MQMSDSSTSALPCIHQDSVVEINGLIKDVETESDGVTFDTLNTPSKSLRRDNEIQPTCN